MISLHWKLAGVLGGLLALVAGALLLHSLSSAERYGAEVRQALNRDVAPHLAQTVQPFSGDELDQDALKSLFMEVMVVNPSLEVYLLDEDGKVLAYDAPPEIVLRDQVDLAPIQRFLAEPGAGLIEGDDPRSLDRTKPFSAAPIVAEDGRRGYLYMVVGGQSYDSIAEFVRGSYVWRVLVGATLGLVAASALVGFVAFAWLTKPLRRLRAAVTTYREGRPLEGLSLRGEGEIPTLCRAFERMGNRIGEQVRRLELVDQQRREFVAGVSHDLRTPLASLVGYLELMQGEPGSSPRRRMEYLENARLRAQHLGRLVDRLFELARFEAGDVALNQEQFSMAELVQDVLQEHRVRAAAGRVQLRCRMPRALVPVFADIGLIERVLGNLLDNAIRHTPPDGQVVVQLRERGELVQVSIADTGCGMEPEVVEHVFERTFRADDSRGEGAGLGLAITAQILELHGAPIHVASAPGEGTTFRFALPAARE